MGKYQNLSEIVADIRTAAGQKVMDTIEDKPAGSLAIFEAEKAGAVAALSTVDKLHLMSREIDPLDHDVNICEFDGGSATIAELADAMFDRLLEIRLDVDKKAVAAASFAVGFLPVAHELVALCEGSGGSKWIPSEDIEEARTAYESLSKGEGSERDVEAILGLVPLVRSIMSYKNDKTLHRRHNTDLETMATVVRPVEFYRDLLTVGENSSVPLAASALEILSKRQANIEIIQAENARRKAIRSRM